MTGMPTTEPGPRSPLLERAEGKRIRSADGVDVYYELLRAKRKDAPTLVLANGLGARLYAWEPLIERLYPRWQIISWDYRGLFASSAPARAKSLAILRHAEDALAILTAEGVERASFAGWSMGVQVALEVAAEAPERVDRLVLVNGTHGHALETGFQPLVRVPWVPKLLRAVLETALASPRLCEWVRLAAQSEVNIRGLGGLMGKLRNNPRIEPIYRRYVNDVFGPSFPNYLRLFLELDAHSVYHLLPGIEHRALVVSGGLDPLTPSYQSREIARRLRNAEHLHFPLGSHFVLLEYELEVARRVVGFLDGGGHAGRGGAG